jgi:uncharacterized protein (DUF433 family)
MNITLHLDPEVEKGLTARAQARGLSLDDYLEELVARDQRGSESLLSGDAAAKLDWSQCPAVESVPEKISGAWVFQGTRMPVSAVFENLEDGLTIDQIVELYDGLTREQVQSVLDFAARSLEAPA